MRRLGIWTLSFGPALVVQSVTGDSGIAKELAYWLWALPVFGTAVLVADFSIGKQRRLLQFRDDPPNLVIGVAKPTDKMGVRDHGEWLHLTVKNKKQDGRRTRTAKDCLIRLTLSTPSGEIRPQLYWSMETGRAQPRRAIEADTRVYIPTLIKGFPIQGQVKWSPAYGTVMNRGDAHITEEQWYQQAPGTPLDPGGFYFLAVSVEYDGGRITRPKHFTLSIPKNPAEASALLVDPDSD